MSNVQINGFYVNISEKEAKEGRHVNAPLHHYVFIVQSLTKTSHIGYLAPN